MRVLELTRAAIGSALLATAFATSAAAQRPWVTPTRVENVQTKGVGFDNLEWLARVREVDPGSLIVRR